jgi:hypothetical protein
MFKCECGFEAKSKLGLASHKRSCKFLKEKTKFDIVDSNGVVFRTYSVKIHGEKAGELAKMFVNKFKQYKIK